MSNNIFELKEQIFKALDKMGFDKPKGILADVKTWKHYEEAKKMIKEDASPEHYERCVRYIADWMEL